jgi:hypothetical protein
MAAIRTKFDLPLRRQIGSYLILRERNKKQTHATCPGPGHLVVMLMLYLSVPHDQLAICASPNECTRLLAIAIVPLDLEGSL